LLASARSGQSAASKRDVPRALPGRISIGRTGRGLIRVCLVLAAWLGLAAQSAGAGQAPRISMIIDDLGYQLAAGRRATDLPGPVACAILPGTPRGSLLAARAHANGKEVLLHLPMQPVSADGPVSPGSMTLDMTRSALVAAFETALGSVPYAVGVNNHQGSLLTRHPGHMRWLMESVQARELFFIDSYTTHKSVALAIATEQGVAAVRRDVFLDVDPDPAGIGREFERLKSLARQNGLAVGIGHPYPATLEFLEKRLPELAADGIELVPLRALLPVQ